MSNFDNYFIEKVYRTAIQSFIETHHYSHNTNGVQTLECFGLYREGNFGFPELIGAAMLIISGIGSWRTILSVFVGGYFMGYLFNLWGANEFMNLPPHVHLVLGGLLPPRTFRTLGWKSNLTGVVIEISPSRLM